MIHHSNLVICHALRNSEVVNFAKTAIREGYNEFFKNWVKQISEMLDFAFDVLVETLREVALGFEEHRMHKTCQALLVCNSNQ